MMVFRPDKVWWTWKVWERHGSGHKQQGRGETQLAGYLPRAASQNSEESWPVHRGTYISHCCKRYLESLPDTVEFGQEGAVAEALQHLSSAG